MKKWLAVLVIFVVILVVAVACHKSGGGEEAVVTPTNPNEPVIPPAGPGPSPGVPVIVFSSPAQAAQATASFASSQALASAQFAVAKALGVGAQPVGFAPSLSKSANIGNIDPAVAAMVKNMMGFANSATIQRAVKKAGALRAKAMRAAVPSTTLTTDACNFDGQAVISGENTYDDPTNPNIISKYDINFTNCKDDGDMTQLDGKLHIETVSSTGNDGVAVSLLADGLKQVKFSTADFVTKTFTGTTLTSVMTGSFISDDNVTTVANFSDGSFVVTTPATATVAEKVATFEFNGLSENKTFTHNPDGSDEHVTTTKGTFKITSATGGTPSLQVSLALDLTDNSVNLNDAAGTINSKLNGSVDIIYASNPATALCPSGKLNISTVDTSPRVFTTAGGTCPQNGTVKINTATVNYGPGQPIQVAVDNGTPVSFADCAAFDAAGGVCKF
jgi:hypothetical protein